MEGSVSEGMADDELSRPLIMAASPASGVLVAGCGEGVVRGSAAVCVAEAEAGSVTFDCGKGGWVVPGAGGSADSGIVGSLDSGAGPVVSETGGSANPRIWGSLDSGTVGCVGSTAGGGVSLL